VFHGVSGCLISLNFVNIHIVVLFAVSLFKHGYLYEVGLKLHKCSNRAASTAEIVIAFICPYSVWKALVFPDERDS
jgi:hypothetical protein